MMESGAFSSPFLATVADKKHIVLGTRTSLVLWSREVPNYRGMNILTPIVIGDGVLTSLYREDSFLSSIKDQGGKMESREVWKNKARGYTSTPVDLCFLTCAKLANPPPGRTSQLLVKTCSFVITAYRGTPPFHQQASLATNSGTYFVTAGAAAAAALAANVSAISALNT